MESKRKRSENWDSSDKTLLKQIIEEKIAIIENKCVDTNTSKKKREAWQEILSCFNKCSSSVRDVALIQCQWRSIKMQAKKRCSKYKRERGATGGGPPPAPPDHEDDRLMSLIPGEFAVDHNIFDCDGKENNDSLVEINEDVEFILDDIIGRNPADDDPKIPEMQTKSYLDGIKTATKFTRRRGKKNENAMSEEELKARYLEVAIEAKNEEREHFKQKCCVEVENLRAENRRKEEEHQLKMRHMEEEHKIRMKHIEEKHTYTNVEVKQNSLN